MCGTHPHARVPQFIIDFKIAEANRTLSVVGAFRMSRFEFEGWQVGQFVGAQPAKLKVGFACVHRPETKTRDNNMRRGTLNA
jgi:hypothetical protein